jgi:7,8-dihydropterin-6-yl-methyl-4-(beta-D-ribofuranosyl)aminobenzene 5'-phosphate synthase
MKITILAENTVSPEAKRNCVAEWGLSVFIETHGVKILFDTGHSGIFASNARSLGVDLDLIDTIVISHYHWDHTQGLLHYTFNQKKRLIGHPELFRKLPPKLQKITINSFLQEASIDPIEISKGIFYLGEIKRTTNFEPGRYKDDPMRDDSALAIATPRGAAVITGCSHSGICNICEQAKRITGQGLYLVLGGFHLSKDSPGLEETLSYFRKENPEHLFPMHCVDFPVQTMFFNIFASLRLGTGSTLEIPD